MKTEELRQILISRIKAVNNISIASERALQAIAIATQALVAIDNSRPTTKMQPDFEIGKMVVKER